MMLFNRDKKGIIAIAVLVAIALGIYYPVLNTEYAYTDELVGLWQFGQDIFSHTLLQYGRYVTEKLAYGLFGSASEIKELVYIRSFSLAGWVICIPIWYYGIRRVLINEKLPVLFAFFSVLYMLCTPTVSISIGWAACFELFIANTAGLLSGIILYSGIKYQDGRVKLPSFYLLASVLFGLVSLFTYQSGFGCFVIPFLLHFLATGKISRHLVIGIGVCLFIYIVYYFFFRYSLRVNGITDSQRTSLVIDPYGRLKYFFKRPLAASLHFSYLFNEKSKIGYIISGGLFFLLLLFSLIYRKATPVLFRLKYLAITLSLLILSYLPSLLAKENYTSNRTMLALNMAVFFFVFYTIFNFIQGDFARKSVVGVLSVLFVVNAWYNFNRQFISPVQKEYQGVRDFIAERFKPDKTDTIYFIRPAEDFFVRKFNVTRSWDEFGVPSNFFNWSPEFFSKQVIYELTGDREIAKRIIIQQFSGTKEFEQTGTRPGNSSIIVNEEIIVH